MTRPAGSAIGRYQISGFVARGDTSIIYEALEPESGRKVALKILPPSAVRDPDQVESFLRLAGRLAGLDHANLLPVIDYGREDGLPFVATPIAPGGDLQSDLEAYRDPKSALPLVADLARAVDYLHRNEILHGRIGPGHVLFGAQGEPLLTGFGRPYTQGASGSEPAYLAPEQRQGRAPDVLTDVYQLGALLYHLLLGQPPDPDADLAAASQAAGLDEDVTAILATALAVTPEERYGSAAELADQLTLASQPPSTPESSQEPEPELAQAAETPEQAEPPEPAAPEHATPLPFRDTGTIWQIAAIAVLAFLLALCCLMAAFAAYTVSGRLRPPRATAQVDTNVRAGPAIGYPIVGILRAGQQADIHGVSPDGNWWQIGFDGAPGGRGWVPAAFVIIEQMGTVDVVEPPPLNPGAALPSTGPPDAGLAS